MLVSESLLSLTNETGDVLALLYVKILKSVQHFSVQLGTRKKTPSMTRLKKIFTVRYRIAAIGTHFIRSLFII